MSSWDLELELKPDFSLDLMLIQNFMLIQIISVASLVLQWCSDRSAWAAG